MNSAMLKLKNIQESEKTLNDELERAKETSDRRASTIAAEREKINQLESSAKLLDASKATLESRLNGLIDSHGKESDRLKKQAQTADSATKAAEEKAAILQRKIDELERTNREADRTAKDQAARINSLEATNTRLEGESSKAKAGTVEQDAVNNKLQGERAALEHRVLELTQRGDAVVQERDALSAEYNTLMEQGRRLLAEHRELQQSGQIAQDLADAQVQQKAEDANAEAQQLADDDNAMVCDSETSSGCDFLGIDRPIASKIFATGEPLGNHLLPLVNSAIEQKQAAALPQDISKSMLAMDANHAICVVAPRFKSIGNHHVEPITLVCEMQPKNFEYLSQHLLLPYRDPRDTDIEPTEEFSGHYARMCLLSQVPEVWYEAAIKCNLYKGHHANYFMEILLKRIHDNFGKLFDPSRRVANPDALKQIYEAHWNETVYRLSVFPAFKGALIQWAMDRDPENLFGRWMPHVLGGVPLAEAIHECPPAAPTSNANDNLDTEVPDADTGIPTGLEVLNATVDRLQTTHHHSNNHVQAASRVAAPAADYDADGENVEQVYDFEGLLQTGRRGASNNRRDNGYGQNAIAHNTARRGERRPAHEPTRLQYQYRPAAVNGQDNNNAASREEHRPVQQPTVLQYQYRPAVVADDSDDDNYSPTEQPVLNAPQATQLTAQQLQLQQAAAALATQIAQHGGQQHTPANNVGDYYAAQRNANDQHRQNQQNGATAYIPAIPTGPRAMQTDRGRTNERNGRGGHNRRNDQSRAGQITVDLTADDDDEEEAAAMRAYMAGRSAYERGERGGRRRGRGGRRRRERNPDRDEDRRDRRRLGDIGRGRSQRAGSVDSVS